MSSRGFLWGAVGAAAAVMFVVGFGVGSRQAESNGGAAMPSSNLESTRAPAATPEPPAGPKYALFLFEDEKYQWPAEGEMRNRIREYGTWARGLAESGRFVDGEKLADDGRFCRLENGTLTSAGPQSDATRGVLGGYFVIGAASLDEAMELAKSCPHLKYGGTLEIRHLERT